MKNESTTTDLTPEELAIITRRREEKAKAEAEAEAKRVIALKRQQEAKEKAEAEIKVLVDALRKADKDNVLCFDNGKVTFCYEGFVQEIAITEHRVYPKHSWRGESRGLKYLLSGRYNEYRDTWYKSAATVVRKIQEFHAASIAAARQKDRKASLSERALKEMTERHPHCTVTFNKGWDYTAGKRNPSSTDRCPDTIKVASERGHVSYRFSDSGTGVSFFVNSRYIKPVFADEIDAAILAK